jgi:hypothetical protein
MASLFRSKVISISGFCGRHFWFPMAGHIDSDIYESGFVENVGVNVGSASKSISVQTLFYFQFCGRHFEFRMSDNLGSVMPELDVVENVGVDVEILFV